MKYPRLSKISLAVMVMLLIFVVGFNEMSFASAKNTPVSIAILPNDGQAGVAVTSPIVIQFSESVKLANGDTLTSQNAGAIFTLQSELQHINIDAQVKWSPTYKKLTIQPKNPLSFGTKYLVQVPKGQVKNKAGEVNEAVSSEFTTEWKEPPLSVTFVPQNQASEVPIDTNIILKFNKHMLLANKKEITDAAIPSFMKLCDASQKKISFTGHWDEASRTIVIDPIGSLAPGTSYTVSLLEKKLQDRQGTINQESVQSSFTTNVPLDVIAPAVSIMPAHGAKNVALSATVTVQFAEDVVLTNGEALNSKSIRNLVLFQDSQQKDVKYYATWNKSKRTISLHLKEKLKPYSTYSVQLPAGVVKDTAGNANEKSEASFMTKGK